MPYEICKRKSHIALFRSRGGLLRTTEALEQYRLSKSPYKDQFLLKGGLLLMGRGLPQARPTRDIDLLSLGSSGRFRLRSGNRHR
jgi:hypothetical protein